MTKFKVTILRTDRLSTVIEAETSQLAVAAWSELDLDWDWDVEAPVEEQLAGVEEVQEPTPDEEAARAVSEFAWLDQEFLRKTVWRKPPSAAKYPLVIAEQTRIFGTSDLRWVVYSYHQGKRIDVRYYDTDDPVVAMIVRHVEQGNVVVTESRIGNPWSAEDPPTRPWGQ